MANKYCVQVEGLYTATALIHLAAVAENECDPSENTVDSILYFLDFFSVVSPELMDGEAFAKTLHRYADRIENLYKEVLNAPEAS